MTEGLQILMSWRWLLFPLFLVLLGVGELFSVLRPLQQARWPRWRTHLALALVNTFLNRLLLGAFLLAAAELSASKQWGLLHLFDGPALLEFGLAVMLLDLGMYVQHLMFHQLPGLWQCHRVHHSDLDMDVSTALRIHPLEILISLGFKVLWVLVLGAPLWAVIAYELILSLSPLLYHANIHLPQRWERFWGFLIMTPRLHQVHHSSVRSEANSNYGVMTTLWDRLFGTFVSEASQDPEEMEMGLLTWRSPQQLGFKALLFQPFAARLSRSSPAPSARSTASLRDRGLKG